MVFSRRLEHIVDQVDSEDCNWIDLEGVLHRRKPNEVVSSVSEQGNTTGSSAKGPSGHNSSVKECITHVMGLGNVRSHKQPLKTS